MTIKYDELEPTSLPTYSFNYKSYKLALGNHLMTFYHSSFILPDRPISPFRFQVDLHLNQIRQ
jgi:hypothetical protein